jgi:arylsulfatase A-like enzyme
MPARASFINGRYSHNHCIWKNSGEVRFDEDTFFLRLQQEGYYTAHIGKSHYYKHGEFHMKDREKYMRGLGFNFVHEVTGPLSTQFCRSYMTDAWGGKVWEKFIEDYRKRKEYRRKTGEIAAWPSTLSEELFLDAYVGRQAQDFIDGYDREEPFCLFVGFPGPHPPFDAPGKYASMYDPTDSPAAIPGGDEENIWLKPDNIAQIRANYFGKISIVDHWIGRIIDACEKKGLWDDILVFFWSDHGEMLGDHGRIGKSVFYEQSIMVPFIVRWPRVVSKGMVNNSLVHQIDIYPTILDAAGAGQSPLCQGLNLMPVLDGTIDKLRDAALSENGKDNILRYMVRTDRHKIEVDAFGNTLMLIDLKEDPDELSNLAGKPDKKQLEYDMKDRLFSLLASTQPIL